MYSNIIELGIIFISFFILSLVFKFIFQEIKKSEHKLFTADEYLPEEEIATLRQVLYLLMMFVFFFFILYTLIYHKNDLFFICILEIVVLASVATTLDYSSWKDRILFILLIPFGSFAFILFSNNILEIMDLLHVFVYVYLIKIYYDRFREFTESNGLGIAILLLFFIIFISFIITTITEGVDPLDAVVIVSNAFTSNGYDLLGSNEMAKLNCIFLVWGGYLLSGVGTATLTAGILIKHFNKRFDELEELIKDNKGD